MVEMKDVRRHTWRIALILDNKFSRRPRYISIDVAKLKWIFPCAMSSSLLDLPQTFSVQAKAQILHFILNFLQTGTTFSHKAISPIFLHHILFLKTGVYQILYLCVQNAQKHLKQTKNQKSKVASTRGLQRVNLQNCEATKQSHLNIKYS